MYYFPAHRNMKKQAWEAISEAIGATGMSMWNRVSEQGTIVTLVSE